MKRYAKFTRLLALVLTMVLLTMSLAGCFGSNDEPTAPSDEPNVSATQGTEPPEETEPPTIAPTEPEVVMGTVNTDKLNVRTKANSNSPSVKKLAVGTRLEILEILVVDDVTWGRTAEGWVNMKYVTLDSEASDAPTEDTPAAPETPTETTPTTPSTSTSTGSGKSGTITAESLNVRKGPGTKYDSVGKVKKGDKVEILETDGNWGKISNGWISLKYVKMDGSSSSSSSSGSSSSSDSKYSTMVTDGNTKALGKVTVGELSLNVRYGPSTDYEKVSSIKAGETVSYYQKKGNWIRIEKGWISYKYVTEGSSSSDTNYSTLVTDGNTKAIGHVTVNASSLKVRYGPSTDYDQVGSVKNGEQLTYYQKSGNWVRISNGWISYKYVTEGSSSTNTTYTTGKGTVTASALMIREGAGTNYKDVGKLYNGDSVEILEVKDNWGRIDKGWICLDYVKMN